AENFIPKNPNREIVHIIPREYKIDSEGGIKDPVGMNGIRLEVDAIIVDGSKSATQSVVKCVKAAGIEIEDLVFSSLASAEAVLSRRQKELGVMLLDIGGGTSDFSVWEEGRLIHAGIFPVGGLHITQDLAVRLQTHIDVAEQVKIRYGHSIPDTLSKKEMVQFADFVEGPEGIDTTGSFSRRDVAEVVEARLKDVFELSAKELKKIDKAGLLPAGVVLIGGASRIPGIMELAKHELRLPIEIGSRVNLPTLEDKELQDLLFTYPVALGLVAWQINKTSGSERFFYNPALSGYTSTVKNWLRMFLP
ncbi:MAG: cell division protein FtsA, partial [Candidatus Sungbacteria bacterium RIFCSPLOWO2_02_FULL_47_9]